MSKHEKREVFRSFVENYIFIKLFEDTEIEGNVQEILRAFGDDNNDEKEQLVHLIEDFHKHYQSLYERYNHLTEELRKKAGGKCGKGSSSSRSDSSDSDEKEKLHPEYQTALSEMQEAQKSRLVTENARVKKELELAETEIARLSMMQTAGDEERSNLTSRVLQLEDDKKKAENKIPILKEELHSTRNELLEWEKQHNSKSQELYKSLVREETLKKELDEKTAEITEFLIQKKTLKQELAENAGAKKELELAETEIARLRMMQKAGEEERSNLTSRILQLEDKERELSNQMELESLEKENSEFVIQIETLKKQFSESLTREKSLKETLQKNKTEISKFVIQIKTLKQELANKNSEVNKSKEEQETLLKQIKGLERDLNTRDQKLESEKQLKGRIQELLESLIREKSSKEKLQKKTAKDERKIDSLHKEINSILNQKHEVEVCLQKTSEQLNVALTTAEKVFEGREELATKYMKESKEVYSLQKQMELLRTEKSQLETQIESLREEKDEALRLLHTRIEYRLEKKQGA